MTDRKYRQPTKEELAREYRKWHWGSPAKLFIKITDPMVPNVAACGRLKVLGLKDQELTLPAESWLAYEPTHPRQRLHVILPPKFRNDVRNQVKHVKTVPLQEIAEATGGDHADYPLPRIQAYPLGILDHVVYFTHKEGEEDNKAFDYIHEFGKEHSRGIKPILAADVSGRLWIAGGSYRCPYAGITG